jgi:hypothetical protein
VSFSLDIPFAWTQNRPVAGNSGGGIGDRPTPDVARTVAFSFDSFGMRCGESVAT